MATQYTTILKLALPVQGELSGTWGDVVNNNITSMVEEAVAGRAVIDTWSTNSHTLTTANGLTSESRCAMLEFTDTGTALTGAGEVICPTASKIYICKNDAGQQITIKTSAGTGVAIPDGTTMFVFCDGTNVVEAITNFDTLKVDGYTISLGGALTTGGAFTTSGAHAVTITATGTTNVTVPTTGTLATLAGTETFTNKTLTSPTISGGTIDNATIGGSTPAAGSFTTATATTGNITTVNATTVDTTNVEVTNLKAKDGTASATIADSTGVMTIASSVLTTTDINAGTIDNTPVGGSTPAAGAFTTLSSNSTTTLNGTTIPSSKTLVDTDSSQTLTNKTLSTGTAVTAGTIDNAAIGGSTPAAGAFTTLSASGNVTLSGGTANGILYLDGSKVATSGSALTFDGNDLTQSGTNAAVSLQVNTQNAGISASNYAEIQLADVGATRSYWRSVRDGSGATIFSGNDHIRYALLGSEQMRLNSTGLGIGTSSPQAKLQVLDQLKVSSSDQSSGSVVLGDGSSTAFNVGIGRWNGATNAAGAGGLGYFSQGSANSGGHYWYTGDAAAGSTTQRLAIDASGNVVFNETGADVDFRIESDTTTHAFFVEGSSGNVGIGTSSPGSQLTVGSGGAANPASTVTFHKGTASEYRLKLTSSTFNSDGEWLGLGFGYSDNYMKAAIIAEAKDANARTNLHFALQDSANSTNASLSDSKMVLTYTGNVGIGTSTVTAIGSGYTTVALSGANGSGFRLYSGSTEHGRIYADSTATVLQSVGAAVPIVLYTNGAERQKIDGSGNVVFNEQGADADFRIESDTNTHAFFLEGSSGNVGIGTSSITSFGGSYKVLDVVGGSTTNGGYIRTGTSDGSVSGGMFSATAGVYFGSITNTDVIIRSNATERLRLGNTEAVFNDPGNDYDFRIESDTNTHAFFLDAGNSRVGIGTASPAELLHLNGGGLLIGGAASSINYSALVIDYNSSTREARIAVGGQSGVDGFLTFTTTSGGSEAERMRIKSTGQLRFVPLAADPAGAEAGDVYYNSSTNKLRLYDGSSWVDLN